MKIFSPTTVTGRAFISVYINVLQLIISVKYSSLTELPANTQRPPHCLGCHFVFRPQLGLAVSTMQFSAYASATFVRLPDGATRPLM